MQDSQPTPSRRRFFAGAATLGAAAAAVTTVPRFSESASPVAETLPPAPQRGGGYRLSEHVKRYYKTTQL